MSNSDSDGVHPKLRANGERAHGEQTCTPTNPLRASIDSDRSGLAKPSEDRAALDRADSDNQSLGTLALS
jgi:hypothetical protein